MGLFKLAFLSVTVPIASYLGILGLIIAFPSLQTHAFYLHRVTLIWFKDLNIPETWGFLHNQVTTFSISTADGESLHAWHVLPLGVYRRNQQKLLAEATGFTRDIKSKLSFQLLRDDPDARLVIYLHGTAGCIASGFRPDSYRALYSAAPDKIHVVTVDYRGYGLSSGTPSEEGLLLDALALTNWATNEAGISASRIAIFAQSLGTAVAISLSEHLASRPDPISFSGTVLVASFSDVATLTATYRIGGVIPVLSPLAAAPKLLTFFQKFLRSTWMSKDRIARFIQTSEKGGEPYHLTLIHAEDDSDIPYNHTEVVYWHAVNATVPTGISYDELEDEKAAKKTDLGSSGWSFEWRTKKGVIRERVVKYGFHDKLMGYPVTVLAILEAFQAEDPTFGN